MHDKLSRFILVAGNCSLPLKLAQEAKQQCVETVIFALSNSNYQELKAEFETYKFSVWDCFRMLDKSKELGIHQVSFIGKVPKLDFFKSIYKFDTRILAEISKLQDLNDDSLHLYLADKLEHEHGIQILKQNIFLQDLFPSAQTFTQRQATEEELLCVNYALTMAKGIAALDIGQTIVAQNRTVIAVESIEGTNACIKRARKLLRHNDNFIVAKTSKPNQDERFDMPVVGLETLKAMPKSSILCIEADKTFVMDQDAMINYANKNNILIIAA